MRNGIELRRTPGRGGDPETIPCYFPVEITTLLEQLRSNPSAFSLVRYNGTNHFDPYLFDATTAAAGETATEICAADLGSLDDDDMPAALPAGWVDPSAAGATGRVCDEDALQDSIRVRAMPTTAHMAPSLEHAVRFALA
eukprot:4386572-Prymnesium_polylepis.1